MKNALKVVGAAAIAMTVCATASHATLIAQPGETMGLAFGAPLPEGVFFVDLEDYGRADSTGAPQTHTGVNIPVIVWSTPYTFYNTRLEFLYAAPFIHRDGNNVDRVDYYSQLFGPILAHDFGHDFSGSLLLGVRTPDNAFHDYTGADIRAGLSYTGNGFDITGTFYYNGTFNGHQGGAFIGNPVTGVSDAVDVDFTATKKFDKFELGFVGFAYTDINTRGDNSVVINDQVVSRRNGAVAVGGLIGYAFDKFTLQGMVTRQVAIRNGAAKETRGWVRLIVPLYVAPTAPAPIRARY